MMLLTKANRKALPPLYATDGQGENATIQVKFFTPDSRWSWYATEFDPETGLFFGLVDGHDQEMGYFDLSELEKSRGPFGLPIERDRYFNPQPIKNVRR